MSKVHLVSTGEYSDYHIIGIYSTKVLVQQFCDNYNCKASIEEYELDPTDNRKYLCTISMCKDDSIYFRDKEYTEKSLV